MNMTDELKALMNETEVNNSFDINSVSGALKMALENSFAYLYRLQRNVIKFKEYHFPTSVSSTTDEIPFGDMFLDDKYRVCINIDNDIVNQNARKDYYSSDMYRQEFTLEDIAKNKDIYERIPLVCIDRRFIFNFKIRMMNGYMKIILPYKTDYLYTNHNETINHVTDVILVENNYYRRIETNAGALNAMKSGNDYRLNPSYSSLGNFRTDGTYVAFVEFPEDKTTSSLMMMTHVDDEDYLVLDFSERIKSLIVNQSKNFYITLIFFPNMYEHKMKNFNSITAYTHPKTKELTSPIMVIERGDCEPYNMPIPTENIFALKRINDSGTYNGEYELYASDTATIHYPNMYTIKDENMKEGDTYRLFYFYKMGYDLHYSHLFGYYYRYLKRKMGTGSLEEAVNKVYNEEIYDMDVTKKDAFTGVFRKLFNYNDYNYQYDILDFTYRREENEQPYEYKVRKMKEFVQADTRHLISYVREQNRVTDSYFTFTKKLDLEARKRTDTSNELTSTVKFDEPMYLFLFTNKDTQEEMTMHIWIDGLLCMDYFHRYEYGVDYIYIPVREVTDNSYIEVEICHSFDFETDVYFPDTSTYVEVNVAGNKHITPTLADIIMIDKEDESIIYDTDKFEILRRRYDIDCSVDDANGDRKVEYTTLDSIKIRAKDTSVTGRAMRFCIHKNAKYVQMNFDRTSYPLIQLGDYRFKHDMEYLRIYHNGKLMPQTMYIIKDNFDMYRIQLLFKISPGDKLALDISGPRNELLYFVEEVPSDYIIDLKDHIDKPFDIRYFDVFLNGRKLNETQVFKVTDTKIQLINVNSKWHLEIYQKDRDEEYFGWTKNPVTLDPYYNLDDFIEEPFVEPDEKDEIFEEEIEEQIKEDGNEDYVDIGVNTNDEDKNCDDDIEYDENFRFLIFYYDELLPNRLMVPQEAQFNKEYIKAEFPETTEVYLIENSQTAAMMNSAVNGLETLPEDVLYLDPDTNYDTAQTVYFLGDYDELCEELEKNKS